MRKISLYTTVLCIGLCVLFIFSFGQGVLAAWNYAEIPLLPITGDFSSIVLKNFTWKPEDILPGGGSGGGADIEQGGSESIDKVGENYLTLTQSVLWHTKMGLNGDKDALENAIQNNKIIYDDHNLQGGNMKHLFTTNESRALGFVIVFVSETEFHMYMYEDDRLSNAIPGTTPVLVYKNILTYDAATDEWTAARAEVGTAIVTYVPGSSTRRTVDYKNFVATA